MPKSAFSLGSPDFKKAWKTGHTQKDNVGGDGSYWKPEDGEYVARVTSAEIKNSKKNNRPQIVWQYTFTEGEYKNKQVLAFDGLDRPEGLPYLMNKIERMGYDTPQDPELLESVLDAIIKDKPTVKIAVVTKPGKDGREFTNIYVNERLEAGMSDEEVDRQADASAAVSEESGAVTVGMEVDVLDKMGKSVIGTGQVYKIDSDSEIVTVKLEDGKKMAVTVDRLRAAN